MALQVAKLARAQLLKHLDALLLLQIGLAIKISCLNVALVLLGLEYNEISGHKLVSQHFYHLADSQILPIIWTKDSLLGPGGQNFALIFPLILRTALHILEEILDSGGHNNNHQRQGNGGTTICVRDGWDYLKRDMI